MDENPNVNSKVPGEDAGAASDQTAQSSWQEVGRQFEVLGASLAQALRTGWENEETQRQVNEMRRGLESMVKDVEKAIDEGANSPKGQQIRQDARRAAEALQEAGKQTTQEVRPHLITALEQLNQEIQRLIERMQNRPK